MKEGKIRLQGPALETNTGCKAWEKKAAAASIDSYEGGRPWGGAKETQKAGSSVHLGELVDEKAACLPSRDTLEKRLTERRQRKTYQGGIVDGPMNWGKKRATTTT